MIEPLEFCDIRVGAPVVDNRMLVWEPKEDITAFELALLMPMFLCATDRHGQPLLLYDRLPDNAKRHWRVTT